MTDILAVLRTCVVCGGAVLVQLTEEYPFCSTHTAEELRAAAERWDEEIGHENLVIRLYRAANKQRLEPLLEADDSE